MEIIKQVIVFKGERQLKEYTRFDNNDLVEYKNSQGITKIMTWQTLETNAHKLVDTVSLQQKALEAQAAEIAYLKQQLAQQQVEVLSAKTLNQKVNRLKRQNTTLKSKISVMAQAVANTVEVVNSQIVDV